MFSTIFKKNFPSVNFHIETRMKCKTTIKYDVKMLSKLT